METKEITLPEGCEVKEVVGNKIIIREKDKELSKTWEECCKVLEEGEYINGVSEIRQVSFNNICESDKNLLPDGLGKPILSLCQLLICRNAWWKHLGWKPDWEKPDEKHCIVFKCDGVEKQVKTYDGCILAFPTYEVRDQFLESFRDLIEEAKELL